MADLFSLTVVFTKGKLEETKPVDKEVFGTHLITISTRGSGRIINRMDMVVRHLGMVVCIKEVLLKE